MGALTGKRALVTCGFREIGRTVVERLARDGAAVVFRLVEPGPPSTRLSTPSRPRAGRHGRSGQTSATWRPCGDCRGDRTAPWRPQPPGQQSGVAPLMPIAQTTEEAFDHAMAIMPGRDLRHPARLREGGRIVGISRPPRRCCRPAPAVIHWGVAVGDEPAATVGVLVPEDPVDHVGDGLEPAVGSQGGALGLARGRSRPRPSGPCARTGPGRSGRRRHCSLEGDLGGRAGRQLHRLAAHDDLLGPAVGAAES
jgi:hypothetical protein